MELGFFESLIDKATEEMPESVIVPWGYGEPLIHPKYLEMMQYLNQKNRRFYVTTNGTIWKEDVFYELFREHSGCYQVIISIDGLWGSGSIEKTRPGTSEGMLKYNVGMILDMHRKLKSKTDLAVKMCERGQDYQEQEEFLQYWLAVPEIAYVCIGKILTVENRESMRRYPCQYMDNNFMVIRWDGSLVPCTYNDQVINKAELQYGTVKIGSSLIDAYNNETITTIRKMQQEGNYPGPCHLCNIAYTGSGIHGEVEFRNDPGTRYFFQQDYYNRIYSRSKKWKPNSYYQGGKDK
jgi:radical SAM protein with 4Fe4S-binding SPASM domain